MELEHDQIARFNDDGFLLIPELLSAAELAVLRQEAARLFTLEREEILRTDEGEIRYAMGVHLYSEPFARLLRHPSLLGSAHQILGGPVYCHQYKIIIKQPFSELAFPWHQDFSMWHAHEGVPAPDGLNVAVLLDDVDEFNGPLIFLPGSHRVQDQISFREERLPGAQAAFHTVDEDTVTRLADARGLAAPKAAAGAGLLFHCNVVHASAPSISPRNRANIYLSYNRVENYARRPTRPPYYTGRDFAPLQPLDADCLLTL